MKPFFCRIGNKTLIAKKLIKLFPKHKIYVEPFVGSGAILFAKEPSEIEIINDLDKQAIDNFKSLKDTPTDLTDFKLRTSLDEMNKLVESNPRSKTDKLLKNLYLSCNTFSSTGRGKIYGSYSGINKIKKIQKYQDRIKNVKLYNTDYKSIITKYDSKDTFFFIDPPYENSETLYKDSEMDYDELRNIISNIKGYAMITLNDSKNIRNIFKDFVIKSITVPTNGKNTIGYKPRKELIIMNYKF